MGWRNSRKATPQILCAYVAGQLGKANASPATAGWQPSREDSRVLGALLYLPVTVGYKFDYALTFDFLNASWSPQRCYDCPGSISAFLSLPFSCCADSVIPRLFKTRVLRMTDRTTFYRLCGLLRCGTCLLQVLQETGVLCRVPEGT